MTQVEKQEFIDLSRRTLTRTAEQDRHSQLKEKWMKDRITQALEDGFDIDDLLKLALKLDRTWAAGDLIRIVADNSTTAGSCRYITVRCDTMDHVRQVEYLMHRLYPHFNQQQDIMF